MTTNQKYELRNKMESIALEFGLRFHQSKHLTDSMFDNVANILSISKHYDFLMEKSKSDWFLLGEVLRRLTYFSVSPNEYSVFKIDNPNLFFEKNNTPHLIDLLDDEFIQKTTLGYVFHLFDFEETYCHSIYYRSDLSNLSNDFIAYCENQFEPDIRLQSLFDAELRNKELKRQVKFANQRFIEEMKNGPVLIEIAHRWTSLFNEMFRQNLKKDV